MKVVKDSSFFSHKGKHGNFKLIPREGWKISHSFIDFESGLLIVSESNTNEKDWKDTGFGSRSIPTKEYRIDRSTGKILSHEEWSKYFKYETIEISSEDGNYTLKTTRVYEPDRDSDGIEEELIELKSGIVISSSSRIAFSESRSENLLESHKADIREREAWQAKLDTLLTLKELYQQELEKLEAGMIVLSYSNEEWAYQLEYQESIFKLKKSSHRLEQRFDANLLQYEAYEEFDSLDSFIDAYMTNKQWYLDHMPHEAEFSFVLKRSVVEFFNELRKHHDFTYKDYFNLHIWENFYYQDECVKPSEFKQYCFNCKVAITYNPRHPKTICHNCYSKPKMDEHGFELSFHNVGMSGGLLVVYKKDGKEVKEDGSSAEKRFLLEGKPYVATEARFGGIIIEAEE